MSFVMLSACTTKRGHTLKRSVITTVTIVGIIVIAAFTVSFRSSPAERYLTAPIKRGKVVKAINATGTLKALLSVKVSSQLSGQVVELHADFNDRVTKGQPLAQLDQSILAAKVREAKAALDVAEAQVHIRQAGVEKAEANLANSTAGRTVVDRRTTGLAARLEETRRDLLRKERLAAKGTISQRDVDRAKSAYLAAVSALNAEKAQVVVEGASIRSAKAALRISQAGLANARAIVRQRKAALEQAEIELSRTVIRSPIDGIVIGRNVERGQTVAASLDAPTLFEITQDLRRMELHAKVDEADIGRIRVGPRAQFTVDSFRDHTFEGRVIQVRKTPEMTKNVVTYTVVIASDNSDLLLLPGMTADVRIVVEETGTILRIPNAALRFRPANKEIPKDGAVVWVVGSGGVPQPVPIRTGARDGEATELVEGALKQGDAVVVGRAPARVKTGLFGIRLGF